MDSFGIWCAFDTTLNLEGHVLIRILRLVRLDVTVIFWGNPFLPLRSAGNEISRSQTGDEDFTLFRNGFPDINDI